MNDRGDYVYAQVTSPLEIDANGETPYWYPLSSVLTFLGVPPNDAAGSSAISIDHVLDALDAAWPRLLELFSDWPASKPELDEFFREQFHARSVD